MLEVVNIVKSYGRAAILNEVSLSLGKGEVLGLFGPNGAGKSTLMSILALVARPDGGEYCYDGINAFKAARAVRQRIGFVPQDIALFEDLTVRDNLLCWSRKGGSAAKKRAESLADALNLRELYRKKVKNLSGGMKRRVNLAVALLNDPALLVMDEPLVGVDIEHTACIVNYLRALADAGVTQVISGHSAAVLMPLVDKVMVMRDGKALFAGGKAEFLAQAPGGDAEAALLNILYRGDAV